MFILSVALHVEIGRQIKLNTYNIAIKNKVKKYSLSFFREKTEKIYGFYRRKTITSTLKEEEVQYTIERKKKLDLEV